LPFVDLLVFAKIEKIVFRLKNFEYGDWIGRDFLPWGFILGISTSLSQTIMTDNKILDDYQKKIEKNMILIKKFLFLLLDLLKTNPRLTDDQEISTINNKQQKLLL
jgi:hypothetical protein